MIRQTIPIESPQDILRARQSGVDSAKTLGFSSMDQTRIATAISEITRNILQHSGTSGTLAIEAIQSSGREGLRFAIDDMGCGIADIAQAMQDGFSTSLMCLGAGLPGSKRLMDEFSIVSAPGQGTHVSMVKWRRR